MNMIKGCFSAAGLLLHLHLYIIACLLISLLAVYLCLPKRSFEDLKDHIPATASDNSNFSSRYVLGMSQERTTLTLVEW